MLRALAIAFLLLFAGGASAQSVSFPSIAVGNSAAGPEIKGWIYKPAGPGPFRAIILAHSCAGTSPHTDIWGKLLGKRLKRGKVELRAYLQGRDAGTLADPPPRVLQRLASVQDQVRVWLPDAAPLSVADALRAASSAEPADDEGTAKALMELAQTVLDDFVAARAREGARLAKLIRERVAQLRELARAAEPLVPQAVQAQKERFIARWNEALASGDGQVGPEAAQERALAEATAFAIRIDVAEELGRLAAHLDEIEAVLKKGGEVGKRLDDPNRPAPFVRFVRGKHEIQPMA